VGRGDAAGVRVTLQRERVHSAAGCAGETPPPLVGEQESHRDFHVLACRFRQGGVDLGALITHGGADRGQDTAGVVIRGCEDLTPPPSARCQWVMSACQRSVGLFGGEAQVGAFSGACALGGEETRARQDRQIVDTTGCVRGGCTGGGRWSRPRLVSVAVELLAESATISSSIATGCAAAAFRAYQWSGVLARRPRFQGTAAYPR